MILLNSQAIEDLRLLYRDIEHSNTAKREFFWSVLECVGCEEEFKLHVLENIDEGDHE